MLAMPCPSCSAPVPLAVASERWSCGACGSADALPEPVAERLKAAGEILRAHDASERQLRGVARGALGWGTVAQAGFASLVAAVVAPLVLIAFVQTARLFTEHGAELALAVGQLAGLVPLFGLIALEVALALWAFRRARRRVALAAAALPASAEGEVGGCHVCGGPLRAGVQGVARCGYCGADNVLDAGLVAAAAATRSVELEDYASSVRSESGSVGRALGCSTLALLGVALVAPFTCAIPTWFLVFGGWAVGMVAWLVTMGNQPPTPGNRYGLVDVEGRECVAWYNPYSGGWERSRARFADPADLRVEGVREVPLGDLVGRELEIVFADDRRVGLVGVASDPRWGHYSHPDGRTLDGPDSVKLTPADRPSARAPLWKTCLR